MSWGGCSRRGGVTLVAILMLVIAAVAAPVAGAQTPAGVDQYQPTPPGGEGPINDGGGDDNGNQGPTGNGGDDGEEAGVPGGGGVPEGTAEVSDGGGGELPFTGYPLSTLVFIILALLVAGLVFRALASRKRDHAAA